MSEAAIYRVDCIPVIQCMSPIHSRVYLLVSMAESLYGIQKLYDDMIFNLLENASYKNK